MKRAMMTDGKMTRAMMNDGKMTRAMMTDGKMTRAEMNRRIKAHAGNRIVEGLVTLACPGTFFRSLFEGARSVADKPWGDRKSCLTLSFDCDYPDDVRAIPRLARMLAKRGIAASFACVGYWVKRYPAEHRAVLDEGHELVNHTYAHPDNELLSPGREFSKLTRREKKDEIEHCHETVQHVLGCAMEGFRVPHFKRHYSPDIYGILREAGYRYSSSTWLTNTSSGSLPFTVPEGIVEFPLSTCPRHPFTVFDSWHSFNSRQLLYRLVHRDEASFLRLFRELIATAEGNAGYANVYLDPKDAVSLGGFDDFLAYLAGRRAEIKIATYGEIVRTMAGSRSMPVAGATERAAQAPPLAVGGSAG